MNIKVEDGRLLLNGQPILLLGFSYRPGADTEQVRQDLQRIKQSGANCIQLSRQPADSFLLDLGEEIGLLVLIENRENASVRIHGTDERVGQELLCVSAFPLQEEGTSLDSSGAGAWWREHLQTLHAQHPDRPILVTGFGHPTTAGTLGEATQAEVLQEQLRNILAAGPFVCGAVIWRWMDDDSLEETGDFPTGPFGVVAQDRTPKRALDVLEKQFRRTQSTPSLFLRRPHLNDLPPLELPEGYTLRAAHAEDAEALTVMLGRAFSEMNWTAENVRQWLLDDETVTTTLIIERNGSPVATASARLMPNLYPGSGYVHWVGADPDHRGKQLGYRVSLAVLWEFVRLGCRDAVLETDDFRIPAIKVYRNLGFRPEYRHATHPVRWAKLAAQLEGYL